MDKVIFKDVDGVEVKTYIDPKEIKNWRWMELHISFTSITIFDISHFEPTEFRWNSLCFFIKLNLFHILCTKRDFIATLELRPESVFLTVFLFDILWFPVSHLPNPNTIKYYTSVRSNYVRTDYS